MSQRLTRGPRHIPALVLALALFLPACVGLYPESGPNPAHLRVEVEAAVTQAEVDDAVLRKTGPFLLDPGHMADISQPVWELGVALVTPEGDFTRLQPAGGLALGKALGLSVKGVGEYLVPPGDHRIITILTCTVFQSLTFSVGVPRTPVPVATFGRERLMTLSPGEVVTVGLKASGL